MLPRPHRMTTSAQFAEVLRRGRRGGTASVVVHALARPGSTVRPGAEDLPPHQQAADVATKIGFVVGKVVGNSVVRHRVSRRLRAQMAARLDRVTTQQAVVVRALPFAADADSAVLGADLDRALERIIGGAPGRREGAVSGPPSSSSESGGR